MPYRMAVDDAGPACSDGERHEAMLEASKIIRPALDAFYATLNDEQKRRFDAVSPSIAGWQGRGWWCRG